LTLVYRWMAFLHWVGMTFCLWYSHISAEKGLNTN